MSEGSASASAHSEAAIALVAEALQIEFGEVDPETAIGVTERWDSLAHMRLVLALEDHVGAQMNSEAMLAIESLWDVISYLEKSASGE